METIVRPPESTKRLDLAKRRRWPKVASIVVALAIIALIAGMVYVGRYRPLAGNRTGASGVWGPTVVRHFDANSPSGEHFTQWVVKHQPGATLTYTFPLKNLGRLPVTVESIGAGHPGSEIGWRVARVGIEPAVGDLTKQPPEFQPFVLHHGEIVQVVVTLQMDGCLLKDTFNLIGSALIGYRTLGIHGEQWVTLPETIKISGSAPSCPSS